MKQARLWRRVIAICAVLHSSTVLAEDLVPQKGILPVPHYGVDIPDRQFLTGDWGGTRQEWAERGVQFNLDWTQTVQKITSGGRASSTGYANTLDYNATVDLMRMGALPGALLTFKAESRFGDTANSDSGSLLPVNADGYFPLGNRPDDDIAFTVTNLAYTQFLSETFGLTVGKFDTLDADPNEFASGRGVSQFMNTNFVFNAVDALRLPYSTTGGALLWLPVPNGPDGGVTVKSLLVTTTDSSEDPGLDNFDDGLSWLIETDTQYRLLGLQGGQNIGFLYSFDQDFKEIGGQLILPPGQGLEIANRNSTWALYWSAWQYLIVTDPSEAPIDLSNRIADRQGVGLFARAGIADQQTNPVEASFSGGIGGRGVFGRSDDTYGVGYYYSQLQTTRLSGDRGLSTHAQGGEAYYDFALVSAVHLTFDIQIIDSILPRSDTAFIVGGRLRVVL